MMALLHRFTSASVDLQLSQAEPKKESDAGDSCCLGFPPLTVEVERTFELDENGKCQYRGEMAMNDQDNRSGAGHDSVLADLEAPEAEEVKGGPTPQSKRTLVLQSSLTGGDSSSE
ncbi:MAG: hypothetical protein ABI882_04670 [Acidobacteriota bacterium]